MLLRSSRGFVPLHCSGTGEERSRFRNTTVRRLTARFEALKFKSVRSHDFSTFLTANSTVALNQNRAESRGTRFDQGQYRKFKPFSSVKELLLWFLPHIRYESHPALQK